LVRILPSQLTYLHAITNITTSILFLFVLFYLAHNKFLFSTLNRYYAHERDG